MCAEEGHNSTVGRHYDGDAGAAYFSWQNSMSGEVGGRLNARKFNPHLRPDATVIDFGCGAGYMLEQLVVGERIGIEPAAAARQAATSRGLRVVASAGELPAESADAIVSNHALEHTLEPLRELRDLRRLLKPGAQLRLWVPIDDWRAQTDAMAGDENHHLYTWTPLLMRNLLEEAGLTVISVRVITHAWPPRTARLASLPQPVFDALGRVWSRARRRRQLEAVAEARRPSDSAGHPAAPSGPAATTVNSP
jgi:SAM-dependent methyltransferase